MPIDLTEIENVRALAQAYAQIPEMVLEDLEDLIRPDELSYNPGDDRDLVGFREGQRNVWIHIKKRRDKLPLLVPQE
jgi:hypothetical protein